MAKKHIVTLTSDFGTRDGYVASMKGVLLGASAELVLVDITHEIPPGDVLAGAFVLRQVLGYFPPETVHLAVVDPGVGTDRRILAARYAGQTIVAPDNGLISLVDAHWPLEAVASVRNTRYFLPSRVGATFDGRDVMAPVAAALATGTGLAELGPAPPTYRLLELPKPEWDGTTLATEVIHVDAFGNCVTNLSRADLAQHLPRLGAVGVWAGGRALGPLRTSYAEAPPAEPLALLNSLDLLEVAVNAGSAAKALGLGVGAKVSARYADW